MAKKKANKNIPIPILILICTVLLFAANNSLSTLALAIWGDSVMGTVDSYDSRRDDTTAQENRSRTISKGYWFLVNGKEYRGYVIYSSDEAWPSLDEGETRSERIRYLDIFPYINKPSMLCEFDEMGDVAIIYHILAPIGYVLLLLLVTRTARGGKKKKKVARKPAAPQIIDARSDTDMFCPNCGNKLRRKNTGQRPRHVYGLRRNAARGNRILYWLRKGGESSSAGINGAESGGNFVFTRQRWRLGRFFQQV